MLPVPLNRSMRSIRNNDIIVIRIGIIKIVKSMDFAILISLKDLDFE
jgi:hypothetical protein